MAWGSHPKSLEQEWECRKGYMTMPGSTGRPCQISAWVFFDSLFMEAFRGVLGMCLGYQLCLGYN